MLKHLEAAGIHYEKHTGFQKKVMVNFGIPIKVVDYKTVYEQNSAKGIKQLITAVRTCIRKNMLHIANLKYYDEQVLAMKLMEHDKGVIFYKKQSQLQWLKQSQNTLNLIEQFKINDQHNYEQLIERIKEYRIQLKHLGINNQSVAIRISLGLLLFKFILLFFLSPLWLWAVLNCGVAYLINRLLFKMFKPPVFFWGSLKFAFGFLLSSFIFLLQTIVFYFVFRNIGFAIIYFVSLPFLGIFWYRYNIIVIKFVTQVKLNRLADSRVFNNLIRLQRDLISRLTSLET